MSTAISPLNGGRIISGGPGDDTHLVSDLSDQVIEAPGGGTDTVETWLSGYTLPDNVESLRLTGTSWSSGTGNALNNAITGNAQPNILDGGAGDDVLMGGGSPHEAGHVIPRGDTFIIRAGEGSDTILGFHPGDDGGDLISLPGFDYRSLAGLLATATEVDGAVVFRLSETQALTVRGEIALRAADFTARDFDLTASLTGTPRLETDAQGRTVAVLTGRAEIYAPTPDDQYTLVYIKDAAGTKLGEATTDANGIWHFTTAPLAEGTHAFTATSVEAKRSPDDGLMHFFEVSTSSPLAVTVPAGPAEEEVPPPAPTLLLDAASDTGVAGNNITADTTPILHGTAATGSTVTLYGTDGVTVLGTATAQNGAWSITAAELAGGAHNLVAVASLGDLRSDPSASLALVINLPRAAEDFPTPGFDRDFYLVRNADVAAAGMDALEHYQQFGWREGRDPNALFDVTYYLDQNPDVAASGLDPLQHYMEFGWQEGRDPSLSFSTGLYLAENPEAAGGNPLLHYLTIGQAQDSPTAGATPHATAPQGPLMDAAFYFARNPDVAAAGMDPQAHFDQFGWREGRDPNAWFDLDYYLANNADVAAAGVNPVQHYLEFGWTEHRDPSAAFSGDAYLAANADVAAAGVNPLAHYLQFGIGENRDLGLG
ncbi:hypothetical protein CR162_10570 [Pseudoroseomonas rhizosphaerae]|uniref:Bacterial Ig-like domain-containing protein n=1 Tax=Teichococcus rhizosphaerae TaxID=1335062 RepID=A0A2C7AE07_9PROT|nr:Ig-like domain-containing protein [Pseudoroseomonas rhizosphaerae]PHK94877.1 hypothetical protein CR162_10570 [Pseudoroseomonas rhizosphaerae]